MTKREEILAEYIKVFPLALALPRANECLALGNARLKAPILDLGCGDGVFSRIFFGGKKIDVGLDIDKKAVRLAMGNGGYRKVIPAPADKIPFEKAFFNTVFSNSVLEHIEDLELVFREVFRVLKEGGRFIFIVPDKSASDYLFYAELLKRIGLKRLSIAYVRLKNKLYRHVHLENKRFWEQISRKNGFGIKTVVGLNSPKTVRVIDFFSPFALPDYALRRIFGHSFIFFPNFRAKIITPYILSYCQPVKQSEATGWCFELVKGQSR